MTASCHKAVIAAALEDWWITTDPAAPFDPAAVAESVEVYLISSGYYIAPDTGSTPMRTHARVTCDASHATRTSSFGPCILRHGHDGPVHKDANGGTWWIRPTPAPPSRKAVALSVFLTLACLAGATVALARGDWYWLGAGTIGALLLGWEVADELAERRDHRRRGLL